MPGCDPATWRSPAALLGTAAVVGGLVAASLAAVLGAGCDDPGHLVRRDGVVVLVGGCVPARELPPADPASGIGEPGAARR